MPKIQKPGKAEPVPMKPKPIPKKRMGSKFKKYQEQMEKGPGE